MQQRLVRLQEPGRAHRQVDGQIRIRPGLRTCDGRRPQRDEVRPGSGDELGLALPQNPVPFAPDGRLGRPCDLDPHPRPPLHHTGGGQELPMAERDPPSRPARCHRSPAAMVNHTSFPGPGVWWHTPQSEA